MTAPDNKKKSPVIWFGFGLAAVVFVMLIANWRSDLVRELRFPLNNGVAYLFTRGDYLVAVCHDEKLYVWDWRDLAAKPKIADIQSDQATLVTSDTVVSLERANPVRIVVSGLDNSEKRREILTPLSSDAGYLGISRDSSRIVLLLARSNNDNSGGVRYDLRDVLIDTGQVQPIVTIDSQQCKLGHISVSDNGHYIVGVGEKNSQGWMFVVDAKEKLLIWQREMPDMKKLYSGVFSSDGEIIYARGSDSTLLLLKTSSGEIIDRLLPTEENESTYRAQPVQTVAVSRDSSLVAATVFNNVYVWDSKTWEKLYTGGSGHKVISSMAFSPDSHFLATSDSRQGGKIRIMRMPRH
jgi:WD40 repeat protein